MKKIISIVIVVLAVTFSAQAQKKGNNISIDKKVERALKKLSVDLELSKIQQEQIKPLLTAQMIDRSKIAAKRKALKDANTKPSKEDRKMMRKQMKESEKVMITKMKSILSENQFVAFEKLQAQRKSKKKQ
ncbi:hypothetical protein [Polaribacter sp.]|uniref:hypothetical protein n=1 Tax=Polaribacter sp. TaxID=1920175 RepID=UPI003F6C0F5E